MQPSLTTIKCPSCGQRLTGNFCAQCGEKKPVSNEFSLRSFAEETVEGFTHFDTKFFKSIKTLILKPGALTRHFEEGRRVRFMKPVQLFIISNLLFFLMVGGANIFAIPLKNYLRYNNYLAFNTQEAFSKKFGTDGSIEQVSVLFNEKIASQSKTFIFLFIPFVALACALLFFRKKKYFSLHLVFATHFFTFLLLFFTSFHFLFELPNQYFSFLSVDQFDVFATSLNFFVLVIYLTKAIRYYYMPNWLMTVFGSLFIGVLFIFLLQAYRIFLFYKILYSLD